MPPSISSTQANDWKRGHRISQTGSPLVQPCGRTGFLHAPARSEILKVRSLAWRYERYRHFPSPRSTRRGMSAHRRLIVHTHGRSEIPLRKTDGNEGRHRYRVRVRHLQIDARGRPFAQSARSGQESARQFRREARRRPVLTRHICWKAFPSQSFDYGHGSVFNDSRKGYDRYHPTRDSLILMNEYRRRASSRVRKPHGNNRRQERRSHYRWRSKRRHRSEARSETHVRKRHKNPFRRNRGSERHRPLRHE